MQNRGHHLPDPDPATVLLPLAAAARRLSCSVYAVKAAIRSGELRAVNVGTGSERRVLRVSEAALAEFIEARTVAV